MTEFELVGLLIAMLGSVFILVGLPWLILHYITKWKSAPVLSGEDERMLDELYELGRRLDDRVATIERIMTAENPAWRQLTADPASIGVEDRIPDRRNVQ